MAKHRPEGCFYWLGDLRFTAHALRRMQQRGIREWEIRVVIAHGRAESRFGVVMYAVGAADVRLARRFGERIDALEGLHVICSTNDVVISTYRNRRLDPIRALRRAA